MSKRFDRMVQNPRAGWTMADIEAVCRDYGILCEPPRGGGSHYKVWHNSRPEILTIPFKRPIKAVYIKKLTNFISALGSPDGNA